MDLITTTADLAAFCAPLANAEFIAVDTEFMRERTYWPKLCLAQVAGPEEAAAIDALAEGIDLSPLDELMANPKVLKVFHAARQDLEIFYLRMNKVPTPARAPTQQHRPPALDPRRAAAGNRQSRPQDDGGTGTDPRAGPRLRRGLARPRDHGRDRKGAERARIGAADARPAPRAAPRA